MTPPTTDHDLCLQPQHHLPGCECNIVLGVPRSYRPPAPRPETSRFTREREAADRDLLGPSTNGEAS